MKIFSNSYTQIIIKIVIFYYNFIFSISQSHKTYPIISINGDNTVSKYVQNHLSSNLLNKGVAVPTEFTTTTIHGDIDREVKIQVPKYNGDTATDLLSLKEIYKDGKIQKETNYYINYTYSDNKYYPSKKTSTYNPALSDKYKIACGYSTKDLRFELLSFQNILIDSLVSYSFLNFALINQSPGIKILKYSNNSVIEFSDLSNTPEIKSEVFNKLWIINQEYSFNSILVARRQLDKSLYLFNITLYENKTFEFKYYTVIPYYAMGQAENITRLGIYNNQLIIGSLDKGLLILNVINNYMFQINKNITTISTNFMNIGMKNNLNLNMDLGLNLYSNASVRVSDFIINEKTIYVINKGYGMFVLDLLSNYSFSTQFYYAHPYLNSLDFVSNPFLGSKYLGISVNNGQTVNEFFIEFLIDDEYNPILNKVFTSSSLVVYDNFYTIDLFYTYILNKISKTLIIIRRGMLNSIPSETYQVPLDLDNILSKGWVISFTDTEKQKKIPTIISSDSIFILNKISFPNDVLSCVFNDGGLYHIKMQLKGEVCKNSLDQEYLYTSCDKNINFTYYIYGDASDDNITIIIIVVCLCSCLIFTISIIILWKTNCCREMNKFKIKKENQIKEDLYKEDLRGTPSENLIENKTKPNLFQLGTMVDGKVLGSIHVLEGTDRETDTDKFKENNFENKNIDEKDYNNIFANHRITTRTSFRKRFSKNPISSNTNVTGGNVNLNVENIMINKKENYEKLSLREIHREDNFSNFKANQPLVALPVPSHAENEVKEVIITDSKNENGDIKINPDEKHEVIISEFESINLGDNYNLTDIRFTQKIGSENKKKIVEKEDNNLIESVKNLDEISSITGNKDDDKELNTNTSNKNEKKNEINSKQQDFKNIKGGLVEMSKPNDNEVEKIQENKEVKHEYDNEFVV